MNGFRTMKQSRFDYQRRVRHSVPVDPKQCSHTLHHVDDSGFLDGSLITEQTEIGNRVGCSSCGKFYGYLAELTTPPAARPTHSEGPSEDVGTGSSFCSGQQRDACPVELDASHVTTERLRQHVHRRSVDYREIRRRVSIAQVLELAGWTPFRRELGGTQLRGGCPVHKSQSPRSRVFSVNPSRNIFRCFKCSAKGNQLDLWFSLSSLPPYEAAIDLCDRLGIDVPWLVRETHNIRRRSAK